KSSRQTDRNDVPVPKFLPLSRREFQELRIAQRSAIEILKKHVCSLIVTDELAAVNMSVPCAVLEGDAELPSELPGRRPGIRRRRANFFARRHHRAVDWKPVRPIIEGDAQRASNQQRAEPRA